MANDGSEIEVCPYSEPPYATFTDDHIFPQFLGGRKTIRVCKPCNDVFGHTFEGRASKQLKRLQVFISHFGLDLTKTPATWPAALEIDGETYNLTSGPEGVQYTLSKPIVLRDDAGHIVQGKARSVSEANRITRGLIRAGQAKKVEKWPSSSEPIHDVRLTAPLSFDQDLYRLATKMAASVLVSFDQRPLVTSSEIPAYLLGKRMWPTAPAYCDINPILSMRPPLSHTVYVELGGISYGIVVFFGFMKVYVPLPATSIIDAFLASLDPITGEENFGVVVPAGQRSIPTHIQPHEAAVHFREMNATLSREAGLRGAKRPPKLETREIDLGPPRVLAWTDNTTRFLFPGSKDKPSK